MHTRRECGARVRRQGRKATWAFLTPYNGLFAEPSYLLVLNAYVVSVVLAMCLAFRGASHPRLHWWRRWDPGAVRVALIPYYLLHAVAGVVVTAIALGLDWKPVASGWVNGLIYGLAAAALLRVEISSFGLDPLTPARALLRIGLESFAGRLDVATERTIGRQLGELRVPRLCRVTWRLFERYDRNTLRVDRSLERAAYLVALQTRALRDMTSATPAEEADALQAQEELRGYCETQIIVHRDSTISLGDVPD